MCPLLKFDFVRDWKAKAPKAWWHYSYPRFLAAQIWREDEPLMIFHNAQHSAIKEAAHDIYNIRITWSHVVSAFGCVYFT